MTQALYQVLLSLAVLSVVLGLYCILLWRQQKSAQPAKNFTQATAQRMAILYASQTGTAQHYAKQTQQILQAQGLNVQCLALDQVSPAQLQPYQTVLWLISSYGDAEAPDHALQFQHQYMAQAANLAHLQVAVLGFGSRQYRDFCGFAVRLQQWLAASNSQFLFEPIYVDAEQQTDLQRWFTALETVFVLKPTALPTLQQAAAESHFVPVQLQQRDCLNPNFDRNLFHIRLAVPLNMHWHAGDCIEIKLPHTPLHASRFYSIANIPKHPAQLKPSEQNQALTHTVELLVRLSEFSTHTGIGYGLGSGYLAQQLKVGNTVQARIHTNPSLQHLAQVQALWLIAAGTGLAGALAQLRARDALDHAQNVLLYGERQAENIQIFAREINDWQATEHLSHFELALSQQASQNHLARYVTDLLKTQKVAFLAHIQAGGFVYVCGRLDGVGAAVDAYMLQWLGQAQVDELKASHRYCRDVY